MMWKVLNQSIYFVPKSIIGDTTSGYRTSQYQTYIHQTHQNTTIHRPCTICKHATDKYTILLYMIKCTLKFLNHHSFYSMHEYDQYMEDEGVLWIWQNMITLVIVHVWLTGNVFMPLMFFYVLWFFLVTVFM
jgi:hypothetical protein